MERTTLDLWVGLFVAAGIAALLFLALKVGNIGGLESGSTYTIHAQFDNIGGLKVKAPVKSAGVVVGRVAEIRFDNESYQAEAVLAMSSQYRFPKDTSASIMTSGLLGEQYVSIEAGADDKMLATGDKLKITQGAVVLENLIGQFLYSKSESEGGNSQAGEAPAK
jgi:phospholipid/cholesterol/gamma-HCH transport system substrate-binding protein